VLQILRRRSSEKASGSDGPHEVRRTDLKVRVVDPPVELLQQICGNERKPVTL